MSDVTDIASAREEEDRDRAIAAARRAAAAQVFVATECMNECGEPPRAGSRYCSAECLADHEARRRIEKRLGAR